MYIVLQNNKLIVHVEGLDVGERAKLNQTCTEPADIDKDDLHVVGAFKTYSR